MPSVNETRPALDDVSLALDGLNNAIIEHTKWVAAWSRSAVCGTKFSNEYLSTDSVKQSTFHQWFFSQHHDFLRENNEFTTLERRHNAMHKCVQNIAAKLNAGETLDTSEFNKFLRNEGLFATSLAKTRDALLRLSHSYDFLTGTMNRQACFQLLSQEHARVKRTSE
ncbi:hypothetical protein MNBD_GAMMA26-1127 [hydrothermal vent metagenome]|uniref:Chemoreceptor zinc-binding domain-containing protein n=1 Tax=hydrothermal vent metagenome TaxID=652676 RepID=A0A3B1AUF6_9ZZZZ